MARVAGVVSVAMLATAASAQLVDRPVSAKRLVVERRDSGGKFVFVSKDSTLLFPVPGSDDDPTSGNPGGALVELLSPVETALVPIVGGPGSTGWKATFSGVPAYVFKNPTAPAGVSVVRKLLLKQGKVLRVVSAHPGLHLGAPSDRIAVRVTMGSLRNCTVFTGDAVRKNVAGHFVAGAVPAPAIADCSDESLLGITTTTSTTTIPTASTTSTTLPCDCGGACGPTEECVGVGSPGEFRICGCLPTGATPCGSPGAPVCGGECPTSMFCSAYFPTQPSGSGVSCACAFAGTQCDNGLAWGGAPNEGFPFMCYPISCTGQYPTCGGACGDGGTCSPYAIDAGPFTGCICAVAEPCDGTNLGFACPPGEVCHVGPPAGRECGP